MQQGASHAAHRATPEAGRHAWQGPENWLRARSGREDVRMFLTRQVAAAIAAVATCGAAASADAQPQPRAAVITCTNPASGATWQISIDYDRATVDANPASVSDAEISWRDAKDRLELHARPPLRRSDGHRGVQHRRLLPARSLPVAALKPRANRPVRAPAETTAHSASPFRHHPFRHRRFRRRTPSRLRGAPGERGPCNPAGRHRLPLGNRPAPAQRGFRRRGARLPATRRAARTWRRPSPTVSAAPKAAARQRKPRCAASSTASGTCRRPWRCGGPAPASSIRSTAGSTRRAGRTRTSSAWAAPSPRWCCAAAWRICCMSATPAPTG